MALALLLLAGAGLLMRSFWSVLQVDGGFEPGGVLTMNVDLPAADYAEIPQRAAYYDTLLERIREVPGVDRAGSSLAVATETSIQSARIEASSSLGTGPVRSIVSMKCLVSKASPSRSTSAS